MHGPTHHVLAGVIGIDQNELVQLIKTEIFTSAKKGVGCFGLVLEQCTSTSVTKID